MAKSTQTSNTLDRNNCTVLALKSVTGWQERKCQRILSEAGRRRNKGFDIQSYIADNQGKIENVQFTPTFMKYDRYAESRLMEIIRKKQNIEYNSKEYHDRYSEIWKAAMDLAKELGYHGLDWSDKPMTLKRFAKENSKGVFYIVTKDHALAIIDGIIVDNLVGKQAGDSRQIVMAYKVTGNIKPNIGKVTELDTKKKRHARLNYGEQVIYNGDPIKHKGETLAKKGDLVTICTQQGNGLVVVEFRKNPTQYKPHPKFESIRIPLDGYTVSFKIDRSYFEVTKERLRGSANIIK